MNSPVDTIKERLSIEEVVSTYIKLDRAGANLKARCPFHNEKSASFFISPDRGSYYCFGCGASGDIFTFVEQFEGLDFKGALKMLADRAGVVLETYGKGKEERENKSEKERLYEVMEAATIYFENTLKTQPDALAYLKARGLQEKTIGDFRIGFALFEWRKLYDHLKVKNFTDAEIEKAGLGKKSEKGLYDRFRGRIMFPMMDTSGRVIAFSGRIFVDDEKSAKYLNSPETPIFKKSAMLYGLDKAKQSIRKHDFSIIVEGQFDLILSHQAGFKNTIATSGTALVSSDTSEDNTINNLGLVSRLSQNIIFIFDADKAGFAASIRATPIALALFSDMNVKATGIPEGMDPADLISKKGPEAWKEVIRNSKHIIEFLLDKISTNTKNDILKMKLEIQNKIIPFLALIHNPVKKSHFITMVSHASGIKEDDIREQLNKIQPESKYQTAKSSESKETVRAMHRKDYIERKLLGIILWQKGLGTGALFPFTQTLQELSEILESTPEKILEKAEENKGDLIFEAEVFYNEGSDIKKDTKEMLDNLREEFLKEKLEMKMRELHSAEQAKNLQLSAEILKECQILNTMIQDIKNGRIRK